MITLFIRMVGLIVKAIAVTLLAIMRAEVALVQMGWRAIREWKLMGRGEAWLHAGAGVLSLFLPIFVIVALATAPSSSPQSTRSSHGNTAANIATLPPPTSSPATTRRHHRATAKPSRPTPHHIRNALPAFLRPHHHRHHHAVTAVAPTTHGCTLTSTGNCIRGGEFCPSADAGQPGYDADGTEYICRDGHWETP